MSDLLERTIGTEARVELMLDPGEPWALADKNQLELAILNLAIIPATQCPTAAGSRSGAASATANSRPSTPGNSA